MTSMTVKYTVGGSFAASAITLLQVAVLTGTIGSFGTSASQVNLTGDQLSITPSATGSLVFGVGGGLNGSSSPLFVTPTSASTILGSNNGGSGPPMWAVRSKNATTSGTPISLGQTDYPSTFNFTIALLEIEGSGLAVDASTPAFLWADPIGAAKALTTAAFSPPVGSVLVAMTIDTEWFASPTEVITDSLGLTWTKQLNVGTSNSNSVSIWTSSPVPTIASAGLASASGTANAPALGVGIPAALASASGTANSGTPAIGLTPPVASATGTAKSPSLAFTITPGLASATAFALEPFITGPVVVDPGALSGTISQPAFSGKIHHVNHYKATISQPVYSGSIKT